MNVPLWWGTLVTGCCVCVGSGVQEQGAEGNAVPLLLSFAVNRKLL